MKASQILNSACSAPLFEWEIGAYITEFSRLRYKVLREERDSLFRTCLPQADQEEDVVREDDNLSIGRFRGKMLRDEMAIIMVERRNGIIKNQARSVMDKRRLGQKGGNGEDPLLSLT